MNQFKKTIIRVLSFALALVLTCGNPASTIGVGAAEIAVAYGTGAALEGGIDLLGHLVVDCLAGTCVCGMQQYWENAGGTWSSDETYYSEDDIAAPGGSYWTDGYGNYYNSYGQIDLLGHKYPECLAGTCICTYGYGSSYLDYEDAVLPYNAETGGYTEDTTGTGNNDGTIWEQDENGNWKESPEEPSGGSGGDGNNNGDEQLPELSKRELNRLRNKGVRDAWKLEQERALNGEELSRDWTEAEIQELIETGKVKGYQGHHIDPVNNNPSRAADPTNIEFLKPGEHLDAHGGNWKGIPDGPYLKTGGHGSW